MKSLIEKNPYRPPPELTTLEGTTHLFQLHFDPDHTKENQKFILDTTWDDWDDKPLLITGPETTMEDPLASVTTTNTPPPESIATEETQTTTTPPQEHTEWPQTSTVQLLRNKLRGLQVTKNFL